MWFIYAIIGALITGIGQVLVKRGQIALTPLIDNLVATLIVVFFIAPALLLFNVVDLGAWRSVIGYALVAASMYASFYYIINFGNVSLMIGLINTFPIVTILLAIIYLHEWPNSFQWLGILVIVLGIIFISLEKGISKQETKKSKSWIFWGLIGAVAIGIAEFVTKLATANVNGFTFTFFVYLMYIPPLIVLFLIDKRGKKLRKIKDNMGMLYTVVGIFFIEIGLISIAFAYQFGLATLASPVIASHVLITAVLASLFLKENLNSFQKTGIFLNIIGISIIGIWA